MEDGKGDGGLHSREDQRQLPERGGKGEVKGEGVLVG